jgi:hypothetical protein
MANFAPCLDIIPAKAGIHIFDYAGSKMDSRLRGNDTQIRVSFFLTCFVLQECLGAGSFCG